jgi:RNA polymerase subunit RPABC4/transcription elongation factor Spt4
MANLFYCKKCKRVIISGTQCDYCGSMEINRLLQGTSVNIIGTKEKGKVFKITDEMVKVIVIDASKNKVIKEYKAQQLKKII